MTATASQIVEVPFDGDTLAAVHEGDDVWIVVKRVCEALDVSLQGQSKRLKASAWSGVNMMLTPDKRGRAQRTLCIPLKRLSMWLATFDASRVAEHVRPKIVRYQVEAADVLHAYFFGRNGQGRLAPANTNTLDQAAWAALENLGKRMSFIETHIATDGIISRSRLHELQRTVRNIAKLEHDAGLWQCRHAASSSVYQELREAVGWGLTGQPWRLLPAALQHAVFVVLRRREAVIVRELGVYARNRQTKLNLGDN